MADESTPPLKTAAAAAGGGFVGALVGVVAATTMMGDPDNGQAAVEPVQEQAEEVVVADLKEKS